jgi:sulfotransferase
VDETLRSRLAFITFEALVRHPVETMDSLFRWLQLTPARIDPNDLPVKPHESDSYYRFKYPHQTHRTIQPPQPHLIPPRIEQAILTNFRWFFEQFYADGPVAHTESEPPKSKPGGFFQKFGL